MIVTIHKGTILYLKILGHVYSENFRASARMPYVLCIYSRVTIIENGTSAKNINIFRQITNKFRQITKCAIFMTLKAEIH